MSAVLGQPGPFGNFSAMQHTPPRRRDSYFWYFLIASLLLHASLLLLHFTDPIRKAKEPGPSSLQVVLVNAKSAKRPTQAELLAQANLDGGGNTDAKAVATSPFPAMQDKEPQPELKARMQQVQEMERKQAQLLSDIKAKPQMPAPSPQDKPQPEVGQTPNATDILTRSLEMARLEAQIEREHKAYQSRPKRVNIGARATEFRFAQYIESWRIKVERVGNLNYPEEARQKKLYGSLRITVSIKSDGSLEKAEIDRSSGSKILDEAALGIIKMAAPYAPFPDNIRKDADLLRITRTWTSTRSDQLASE